MDFTQFLTDIQADPSYAGQIVYIRESPAREAQFASTQLSSAVEAMLKSRGIDQLYTHQAQALEAVREGNNIVIATGTASGKSLCYTAPLIDMLAGDQAATALLLFPTKALTQDQFQRFNEALNKVGIDASAGVYDGDTPSNLRRKLRDAGRVIFTNPDMLHAGLLPQHTRWAQFLARLRYLVIDELHVYNGIFGSNAANLFRRFFRLCRHYGASPQIITCSATIGNPGELAERLTGQPFQVIDDDGSPRGKRTYVFWNPPRLRGSAWRSRRSANVEAHELMAMLVQHDVRTITFSKAKMTAEMIHRYVCEKLQATTPQLAKAISPYRGGYLPEERREIERKLFSGELMGVSATRALELGIDVGGLDASLLVGYPGNLASFFQQAGRAGRATDDALVVLVGLDTPVNQYVMSNPEYLFGRPIEQAIIDPDNPFVVTGHLRCAAHEMALPDAETPLFGPHAEMALGILQDNLKVRHIGGCWYHTAKELPQHEISLRSASNANVTIEDVDTGLIIGELDKFDAPPILHPEAIYMHQSDTYRVLSLDLERMLCRVTKVETDYYTQPLGGTDVHHVDAPLREKPFGSGRAYWGEVTTHFRNWGYEKVRFYELDAISRHGVDLPHYELQTMAVWIVPPEPLMRKVVETGLDAFNGLRGIGYAARMILPLFITCDTMDFSHTVGSVNSPWNAVFIYERYPHGLGFTQKAYDLLHLILPAALRTIEDCPCEDGCPCCVGKPLRGELTWNPERGEGAIPSKSAAKMILHGLLAEGETFTDDTSPFHLDHAVRRRLERMREPQTPHPIEPRPATEYPDAEAEKTLAKPDVAHRLEKRRDFARELRKRIAERNNTIFTGERSAESQRPPAMNPRGGVARPTDFPTRPPVRQETEPTQPKELGDSLAARARKLKKQRDGE